MIRDGSALGAIKFNSDTSLTFRHEILRPFLDQYLKEDAPKADVAPVVALKPERTRGDVCLRGPGDVTTVAR